MIEQFNRNVAIGFNGFSDRAPCTNLHKGEQKDRTQHWYSTLIGGGGEGIFDDKARAR